MQKIYVITAFSIKNRIYLKVFQVFFQFQLNFEDLPNIENVVGH